MNESTRAFRQDLRQLQAEHPLFSATHPFWRDCFRGRLSQADVRRWAVDVYPLVRDFPRLYLQVAAKCADERALTFLAETIFEETGSGREAESHPTLFRKFLIELGQPENKPPIEPMTTSGKLLHEFAWSTVWHGNFVEGLALVGLGIERPLPAFFQMLARGFRRRFQLSDDSLRYFAVHSVADIKHAQVAARIIDGLANTDSLRQSVREILRRFWNLQLAQLDEIHRGRRPFPPDAALACGSAPPPPYC